MTACSRSPGLRAGVSELQQELRFPRPLFLVVSFVGFPGGSVVKNRLPVQETSVRSLGQLNKSNYVFCAHQSGISRSKCIKILRLAILSTGLPWWLTSKESACSVGGLGSVPGLGRSPAGGHGNPLQYSFLENPRGQRSLAGYSRWSHKESDMTERLSTCTQYQMALSVFIAVSSVQLCHFQHNLNSTEYCHIFFLLIRFKYKVFIAYILLISSENEVISIYLLIT